MVASRFKIAFVLAFLCVAQTCAGQSAASASLDIHAPNSESGFWGRFFIIEKTSRIAGWITSQDGESIYRITGIHASDATRLKAIVYVPGCALQTVDIAISEQKNYQYSFRCLLLPQTQIEGTVEQRLNNREKVTIEAKYVASWAPAFFECDDGTTTEIPLESKTTLDGQNNFILQIPDLSKDKLASAADHLGEIRFWVRERASGRIVDQLRVVSKNPAVQVTRLGGLPIAALSAPVSVLKFCDTADSFWSHDRYGFAIREDAGERCVP